MWTDGNFKKGNEMKTEGQMKEQISPKSYFKEMILLLEEHNGVIECNKLYDLLLERFKNHMTKIDRSTMAGKRIPLWKNQVDWAKSQGTRQKITKTIKLYNKKKYVVLLDTEITDPAWLHVALSQGNKSNFNKKCNLCGKYNSLAANRCICGYQFEMRETRDVYLSN